MPPPPPMLLLFFLLLLLLPSSPASASPASPSTASFSLNFFPAAGAIAVAQLALSGGASASASASANATAFPGAISLASPGARVQHRSPILFSALGFSTYFAFALLPASPPSSLAFFLDTPSSASRSPPALALVFSARKARLDLAGRTVLQAPCPASTRLHAWIDYNATSAKLHLRLSGSAARTSSPPLLSYPLRLPPALRSGPVLAGFRTSSGNCSLFSWAFRAAPANPMHSQPLNPADLLTTRSAPPLPPHRVPDHSRSPSRSPWGAAVSLLFAAACGAMLTFFLLFLCYSVAARRPVAPVEYPMHPSGSDVAYHKIVLVGAKDDAAAADLPLPVVTSTK